MRHCPPHCPVVGLNMKDKLGLALPKANILNTHIWPQHTLSPLVKEADFRLILFPMFPERKACSTPSQTGLVQKYTERTKGARCSE